MGGDLIWDEWGRITRFFESSRIALTREANLWSSLELAQPDDAFIRVENGATNYQVSMLAHTEAVADTWFLYATALLSYFALAESAAAECLGREDLVGFDGIADWGTRLLDSADSDWSKVYGKQVGAVETAVVRNLIAHGDRTYNSRAVARLQSAGVAQPPVPGQMVVLDDRAFVEYRRRLKSLLNCGLNGNERPAAD